MRRALLVVSIFVMVFLVACSSEEGWGAEAREEYIAGCESSGASNEVCTCMADEMEAKYPDADDPADFEQAEVTKAAEKCAGEGG